MVSCVINTRVFFFLSSLPLLLDGKSLLDQLDDDDEADGTDEIDPALLQEMEQLKSSLEAKSDLQSHREHLRSKLATNFRKYCILSETEKH